MSTEIIERPAARSIGRPERRRGPGLIRRLWPHERELFCDHLKRLDPDSRRNRFGTMMDDSALTHYARRSFCVGGLVYGYVEQGKVRAAGELQGLAEVPRTIGEAAFSVEKGWRRQGLGGELFRAILILARNRGFQQIEIVCQPGNVAMLALARRHGLALSREPDQVHGRARLDLATPASLLEQVVRDSGGLVQAILEAQQRWLRR